MQLYELANQYQMLMFKLEEASSVDDALKAEIESIEATAEEKIKNKAIIVKLMENDIDLIDRELEKLKSKKKRLEDRVEWLKNDICINMQKMNVTSVKNKPYFNVNVKQGRFKVNPVNEEIIPDCYKKIKQVISLDKIAMLDEMIEGVVIPGAELIRESYIEIR